MNNADIAWMLVSTALVLLMTPALAFFYGGLVRSKNALNTMMMSFVALGPVAVVWALLGYSLAFAPGNAVVGSLNYAGLRGVGLEAQGAIPHLLFMCFQGTFAIITPALISGAVVERMRFNAYLAFITLWVLVVYAPVAHWVWGGGFLASMGALDFAGGAVVHVNAASAALVAALVVGPRKDYGRHAILPHNVPFAMLGAGLLWFGWFGFNAGSALSAGTTAALAFANTLLAPAAGYISPASAIAMGAIGAFPSYFALIYRAKTKLDDSLDVVAAHGLVGGHPGQVLTQMASVVIVLAYSGGMTFVLLKVLSLVMPLRIGDRHEGLGLDVTDHGEEAYTHGDGAILVKPKQSAIAHAAVDVVAVQDGGQL